MDTNEFIIASGQIFTSVILGGMAVYYSHRVYKIESNRDNQKLKAVKLNIVKNGYDLGREYLLLPLEMIKTVPTINHSKAREKFEEFQLFAKSHLGKSEFPNLIEDKYRDLYFSEPEEVSDEHYEIVTKIIKSSVDMNKKVTDFLFDIKSLNIDNEKLDDLIYKLFEILKIKHSLDWTAPVLVAHYSSYYEKISNLVIEISNCIDLEMHKS